MLDLGNKTIIKYSKITKDEEDKYNNKTTPETKKENVLKIIVSLLEDGVNGSTIYIN